MIRAIRILAGIDGNICPWITAVIGWIALACDRTVGIPLASIQQVLGQRATLFSVRNLLAQAV